MGVSMWRRLVGSFLAALRRVGIAAVAWFDEEESRCFAVDTGSGYVIHVSRDWRACLSDAEEHVRSAGGGKVLAIPPGAAVQVRVVEGGEG